MRYCKLILASLLATLAGLASGATYTFTGTPYTSATGIFTTSMFISGSFTTAAPLPPNMPFTTIGPGGANPLVTSWSFSDGVQTYTNTDSQVLYGDTQFFTVATNASGGISDYFIAFMSPTGVHTVGQMMNGVGFNNSSFYAATIGDCTTVTDSVCRSFNVGVDNASGVAAGVWGIMATPSVPVPATSNTLLVLMALALGWLAFRQKRLPR